jgi:hypothetical protein
MSPLWKRVEHVVHHACAVLPGCAFAAGAGLPLGSAVMLHVLVPRASPGVLAGIGHELQAYLSQLPQRQGPGQQGVGSTGSRGSTAAGQGSLEQGPAAHEAPGACPSAEIVAAGAHMLHVSVCLQVSCVLPGRCSPKDTVALLWVESAMAAIFLLTLLRAIVCLPAACALSSIAA